MKRFWMVVGYGTPTVKHATLADAKREAERLARASRGSSFTVLESVCTVQTSDIVWQDNNEAEDHDSVRQYPF